MKKLIETIQIQITPAQLERLRYIDQVDLGPFVKRAEEDIRATGKAPSISADTASYALKQYYALATLNPHNMHAISDVLDPYWHAHILHTASYMRFCDEGVGYYMHHDPLDHDDHEKTLAVKEVYDYTLDIINVLFKGHVNEKCYPSGLGTERMICFHFDRTKKPGEKVEAILPADPLFKATREKYTAVLA